MIEKWKSFLDQGESFGAFLIDFSKAFDSLPHDILIDKLIVYGFDESSLQVMQSYLTNRQQRTKVNNRHSSWEKVLLGVPQGSILGLLLFNIHMCDMFL